MKDQDVNLQNLIARVEQEAVDQAQASAAKVLARAGKEADAIRRRAEEDAAALMDRARQQATHLQQNSAQALTQAVRDAELLLKEQLTAFFNQTFQTQVQRTLTPDTLKDLIFKIVEQWDGNGEIEIVLGSADKEWLETVLTEGILQALAKPVTISLNRQINAGFQIGYKGNDFYYDFTEKSIAEALRSLLKPGFFQNAVD